jgi:hypothetical protein
VASPEGLEPPTSDLEGRCSIQLSYGLVKVGGSASGWSGRRDSNSRPTGPKAVRPISIGAGCSLFPLTDRCELWHGLARVPGRPLEGSAS